MWFTFHVNSAWKALVAEDEFWNNCSVHRTAAIVLDGNTTEKDPALQALEMEKCVLIH